MNLFSKTHSSGVIWSASSCPECSYLVYWSFGHFSMRSEGANFCIVMQQLQYLRGRKEVDSLFPWPLCTRPFQGHPIIRATKRDLCRFFSSWLNRPITWHSGLFSPSHPHNTLWQGTVPELFCDTKMWFFLFPAHEKESICLFSRYVFLFLFLTMDFFRPLLWAWIKKWGKSVF